MIDYPTYVPSYVIQSWQSKHLSPGDIDELNRQFRWHFKHSTRQKPCNEFKDLARHIARYEYKVNYEDYRGIKGYFHIYGVTAAKYSSKPTILLYNPLNDGEFVVAEGRLGWNLSSFERTDPKFVEHIRSYKKTNLICEQAIDILGKGDEVVTVDVNEWKDPEGNVITITAGRTQVNLTLTDAKELLVEIPQALAKYKAARRDAIADSIKTLQEQLAILDSDVRPTQTSAE